jgi:hypothetical protein
LRRIFPRYLPQNRFVLGSRPEKNSKKITGHYRILGRAEASIIRFIPRGIFDDAATKVMGDAFDAACQARHRSGQPPIGYEVIARRIVEAARAEEPLKRLTEAALAALPKKRD